MKIYRICLLITVISSIILYSPLISGDMNPGVAALLEGGAGTGLSGVIGYLMMRQLQAFKSPETAKDYAKIWFGYLFFVLCVGRLASFFIHLDVEYLAQFFVGIIFYGGLTAIFGYLYGKVKVKNLSDDS